MGLKNVATRFTRAKATAAELPADTTPFAKALGFGQRSALGEQWGWKLAQITRSTDRGAWNALGGLCPNESGLSPNWVLWHHWPDERVHDLSVAGQGIDTLTHETASQLTDDNFWALVERLTTGRRLVITSDHGYAASGLFPDAPNDQAKYLKERFKSGRWTSPSNDPRPWLPPVDLTLPRVTVGTVMRWAAASGRAKAVTRHWRTVACRYWKSRFPLSNLVGWHRS